MENISEVIKQICKEKGHKQEVIAKKLGITQSTLSEKLSNDNDIKYSLILDISHIINVPIIDIITYPEQYEKKQRNCKECEKKAETIDNLNEYIQILKSKKT